MTVTDLRPGSTEIFKVACSAGKVLAGGVRSFTTRLIVVSSYMASDTQWHAVLRNDSTEVADGFQVSVYAACGSLDDRQVVKRDVTRTIKAKRGLRVSSRPCVSGSVLGGSVHPQIFRGHQVTLEDNFAETDVWTTAFVNGSDTNLTTMFSTATVCGTIPQYRVESRPFRIPTLPPGRTGGFGVSCPRGTQLLSGGVESNTGNLSYYQLGPIAGTNQWQTQVINHTMDTLTGIELTGYAICGKAE